MATRKRCAKRILAMILTAAVTLSTVITDSNITAYATTESEVSSQDAEETVESAPAADDEQGGSENTADNSTPSGTEGTDSPSGTTEDSNTDQPDAGDEDKDTPPDTSSTGSADNGSSSAEAGEESKDETKKEDTDSADTAEGEEQPEGEEVANPDEVLNPEEDVTEDEIGEAEAFANYFFGDPEYNENYIYDYDENEDPIYEMYSQDLDEIIDMAENGMSLEHFFNGTLFSSMTLDALYEMRDGGYSFNDLVKAYSFDIGDVPDSIMQYVGESSSGIGMFSLERAGGGSLTSTGVKHLSAGALGQQSILGKDKVHGPVVKLQASSGGQAYDAFCATYGGSYRTGYTYTSVDWAELICPDGSTLTQTQYDVINFLVNTYLKTTNQSDGDYAGCQTAIWYVINNPANVDNFYWFGVTTGALDNAIAGISSGNAEIATAIRVFMATAQLIYDRYKAGEVDLNDLTAAGLGFTDYYPGTTADIAFWKTDQNNFQWIITWDIGTLPVFVGAGIPTINNYYMEREAITRYNVDITKESVITNELLEGVQFRVDETSNGEDDIDFTFKRGEYTGAYADDPVAQEYINATINPDSFGQEVDEAVTVPYMDDDVKPSGGRHTTTLTTDENGHASTTFQHEHTFKQWYSQCVDGNNKPITYESYQQRWQYALSQAEAEESLTTTYMGQNVTMTYDEIKAIYDAQQVVYTQTRDEALKILNDCYNQYTSRTYKYVVTELTPYTRAGGEDSNGKTMDTIDLPKAGYRKDVQDTTTIGEYVQVLSDGETMIPGGLNDKDNNTNDLNVTNEPWYNQIFINKTDLESGSQILYDTKFDIYEYYRYKVNLTPATEPIYPANVLAQFRSADGAAVNPKTLTSANLKVTTTTGTEIYSETLDVDKLKAAMATGGDPQSYAVNFQTTHSGTFQVTIDFTVDTTLDLDMFGQRVLTGHVGTDAETCSCTDTCDTDNCPICKVAKKFCKLNGTEYTMYKVNGGEAKTETITNYTDTGDGTNISATFTTDNGRTYQYTLDGTTGVSTFVSDDGKTYLSTDGAKLNINVDPVPSTFTYVEPADDVRLFTADGGNTYLAAGDKNYTTVEVDDAAASITLHYTVGTILESGDYDITSWVNVSDAEITKRDIDTNVNTNPDDYTTWGQDNYEIVRVTADIAKQMGWSDTTIGMYTVHRLSPVDQYTGTTFSDTDDKKTGEMYGYKEYGTLYYTQANLGKFCIVESQAPADGEKIGYLGNYEDRDYTKLDGQSSQKNNEGAPYGTNDQVSVKKIPHYIDLCTDTNQYGTYMLTDGYHEYTDQYYSNFVEYLHDPDVTATVDGYDADFYEQSALHKTVALEKFLTGDESNILHDILNAHWDQMFSQALTQKAGFIVNRHSDKTSTYFKLINAQDPETIMNFVGTTINMDTYADNDPDASRILYRGAYTLTQIQYNSYNANAENLNARHGFNNVDYLQVGDITYDNAAQEKEARYYNTEKNVDKSDMNAFIDERTYAFIRFTKYDSEAERYVKDDIRNDYEAGTDHGDADLDGAIYSLYINENNVFDVDYLEGTLDGKLFWAQPLNTGGYRVIWDADDSDGGFTDTGSNEFKDYPHAYLLADNTLHLDYTDDASASAAVTVKTQTLNGIQHPDGRYGGAKHNGWYAVLDEQQVFIDTDNDGYADTWTVQDVTLENGAKVASATIGEITDGELQFDGLYLGNYYIAEEIRTAIVVSSTTTDDREQREVKWLSFAPGYYAETDTNGNPVKHYYSFKYEPKNIDGTNYNQEQVYVQKDTVQYSNQLVEKGAFQFRKITAPASVGSTETTQKPLAGAGFTVYMISDLSLIQDGTIQPVYTEHEGDLMVNNGDLTALFDESENFVGYKYTLDYINANHPFEAKYGTDYDLSEVNRIVYVPDHGYYYIRDILDAYKNAYYSDVDKKWDFSGEEQAIARMYENNPDTVAEANKGYEKKDNALSSGSPEEYYGINGISDGWVATGNTIKNKNEYKLSEIFTNYNGFFRSPDIPWGAYIVVETTTPKDVFTVDPYFVTISDSSPSIQRARTVTLNDTTLVTSLILVKRDAQSGQDVVQAGTSYRIWDYTNNKYVEKYLLGDNGALSQISQSIFHTTEDGRINAVASLEIGRYRLEELSGPRGYHNTYWDYGNETDGEKLGGLGTDSDVATLANMFDAYYGTVEFDVTTERKYKSSGITSSGNLDYIYIGEHYFNDEVLGKLNILKTGEVLVGYTNTDNIEYSDEYTDAADPNYNKLKSSAKDRSVFNKVKEHYDLGTDKTTYRDVTEEIEVDETTAVEKLIIDADGENLAAVYTDAAGKLVTMSGGAVSEAPGYDYKDNVKTRTFYPNATLKEMPVVNGTVENGTVTKEPVVDSSVRGAKTLLYKVTTTITNPANPADVTTNITYEYEDGSAATVADATTLKPAYELTTEDSKKIYDEQSTFTEITNAVMVTYENTIRSYYNAELRDATDMYILAVSGDVINTDYLVTKNADGTYTTTDGGKVTMGSGNKATITYTEAIYDPDTNYKYVLTFADGSTLNVKLVTYGVFLTAENGDLVKALKTGGFEITTPSGQTTSYPDATISLAEDATGETYDFVYEERPLAGATYQITAADDIYTQDGNGGLWFKKGDVVATVTTGNDGEIVSFSPNYKTAEDAGSGNYDYTYYYGNTDGNYTSLTGKKTYAADEFATSGGIKNHWTSNEMTQLEKDIYEIPKFEDATIYPNTFYKEDTIELYRTLYRSGKKGNLVDTDYVTRLENEGNITTHSAGVVTELNDNGSKGYRITWSNTQNLTGASVTQDGELYTIKKADGSTIEAKVNDKLFTVTEDNGNWHAGDMVEKTAKGYKFTHTDAAETGVSNGATTVGAMDLGFTTIKYYPSATLKDNGDGTYDLMDGSTKVATLKGDILETEFGGIVTRNGSNVSIYYEKTEDLKADFIQPTMTITGGTLIVGQETYDLIWDEAAKNFTTALGNTVDVADDRNSVTVTVNGTPTTYNAFKLTYEYDLYWASDENVVTVENDGTLGEVSVYLPLGKYNVQEIATPYGFLINNQVQTVELKDVDQVKEVVFNTEQSSTNWTDQTMNIWTSKGLTWFLGGENTVGEHQVDMKDNEFFTWGTRGDAEDPYYTDQQSLLTFYDLRVKAWSDKDVPEKPNDVGVEISKKSLTGGDEIPNAKLIITNSKGETVKEITTTGTPTKITGLPDDVYTLTEITAPNGYEKAESITFVIADGKCTTGTVTMFDAPETDEGFYFSKKSFTNKEELPGAHIIVTNDATGDKVLDFISSEEPTKFVLPDGDYTFTEITAPDGYDKAESIKVTVKDGKVAGGYVLMYDTQNGENKPEGDRREESEENQWKLGVGIYKADKDTNASLAGAKFGLYTRDNIYNVDGKLLVKKDSMLATATTDYTGHANFDVDIALLSKYLDPNASDADLIFNKTVTYNYTSLERGETKNGYTEYTMITYGCGDVTLRKYDDGTWKLETGETAIVNEAAKTMKYTVNNSIDGNTAVNTGKYYIKELTPPDGYLYDETVYDVKFEYDDDKTMYIPVYAEHVNTQTEVTIDKKDLTGSDEVPGATINVFKVKNTLELDGDGRISHADSNLLSLGSYVSDGTNKSITGLLLSNTEWPRLNNQMVRNNIYVFRETIPGDGYVTTTDIEFKLYQEPDASGDFWNTNDIKVLVNNPTCDQEYVEGTLVAPVENADDWILNGTASESNWDYTKTIDAITVAKWRLVNKVLTVYFNENATQNTIDKVLKESDFTAYDIDKVYFEGNDAIHAKDFFTDKVVTSKPEESKLTFTNYWTTLDDIHMTMHDDTTKVKIRKQDIVTGENVIGAHLKLTDLTAGELIEEWTTTAEDYYFENRLIVGHKYLLEETLAPTKDGYVKSNSITFVVEDTGAIQKVVMEDDFTKLELSKADFTTSEELDGAHIEIWKADENWNRVEMVESYISGQDGYNADGTVKKHYIDYLAPGNYTMVEITAPNGYLVADDVNFTITETGVLQKVQMLDSTTILKIYKYRTGTTEFVPGAKINVYQVPEKYVKYLTDGVRVSVTGGVVDPAEDADFKVNTDTKSSSDLAAYLTGVAAKTTEHRSTYTTTLTLDYSILKADMQTNGPAFTQILPDSVQIADDQLGEEHEVVLDEETGEKAFTYVFGKNTSGASTITVTFDAAYAAEPTYTAYNIDITLPVTISDDALRGSGDIRVTFVEGVVLNIAKADIVEVDSSVETPVVNIELTQDDLKATVVTENKASVIHGLKPGWYVGMETAAPNGYVLDQTPQLFHIENVSGEQALYFYNQKKPGGGGSRHHSSSTPDTPTPTPTPEIGILTLKINGGWWWNNVRTEDNGQSGYSVKVTVTDNSATPLAAATRSMATVAVGFVLIALSAGGFVFMKRRKREEES